jgi:hydroxyacylglutathione hydrolase
MILVRFFDEPLAQASYLIGCPAHGVALVIDPNRLIDQYIAAAESRGLRITAVTETHIHADFVSGTRELAARTGARMLLSDCGPPEWQYAFRQEREVQLLHDRDAFRVGNVEVRTVHTPGHTPEHVSFLVTDTATAHEPIGIATGDFVFANDVGRPDLLEKAAHLAGTAYTGARQLFRSLQWFKTLPDHLQIWPGHGAGSACGKGMSAVPQSTVGYERRFNWAFQVNREDEFVPMVLEGQPEPPRYFARMKRINREGPPVLGALAYPERVAENRLRSVLASGAVVVDTRAAADHAAGYVPGTLSIPFNNSFVTWAGSLLPYDQDLYLLLAEGTESSLGLMMRGLSTIGLDRVKGWFAEAALDLWTSEGGRLEQVEQLSPFDLARRRKELTVLDVRGRSEWETGHLSEATLIPLAELPERVAEVPDDRPIAVHCQGGSRSAIAASLLLRSGRKAVANVTGGMTAWEQAGLPVERNGAGGSPTDEV